jgi:TM2 domain-containing membrane protein YozV
MKKLLMFLTATVFLSSVSMANTNVYELNDDAIEVLFDEATEASIMEVQSMDLFNLGSASGLNGETSIKADTEAIIAIVLCWIVGGLGIHRVYLDGPIKLVFIYFFTCGGIFGIVTFIDFWVLVIRLVKGQGVGSYQGNEKFFGWK